MVPEHIISELSALKEKFKAFKLEWSSRLMRRRYLFDRDSPRALVLFYAYGCSTSNNMYLCLTHILSYDNIQLDLLIEKLHDSIPNFDIYRNTASESKKKIEAEFPEHDEAECFFELYWEQWHEILKIRSLFFELSRVSICNASSMENPIKVIENWASMCERYPLLHSGFYGRGLTDLLLGVIAFSGLQCEKKFDEKFHFDYFFIKKVDQPGSKLVAAYIHYQGVTKVFPLFCLLCRNVRSYDDRVVLIVNIKSNFSSKIIDKLIDFIGRKKVFVDLHRRSMERLECSFRVNESSERLMPATIILVNHRNHSYKKYARCF